MSDNLPPKPQLLKEWHERKGNEPWTLEEIAELIAYASWLGEQETEERIINDLKDQFAFVMEAETKEGLDQLANSIQWSELWQLTFNGLIALIKGENK